MSGPFEESLDEADKAQNFTCCSPLLSQYLFLCKISQKLVPYYSTGRKVAYGRHTSSRSLGTPVRWKRMFSPARH